MAMNRIHAGKPCQAGRRVRRSRRLLIEALQSPAAWTTRPQGGVGRPRRRRQISGIAGPSGVITPQYDPAGNMIAMPKVDDWDTGQALTWDAWGRLVKVMEGSTVVAACTYDALFRRVTKTTGATTRRFYYSDQWQVLEEYVGSATTPEVRCWYGIRDINDIVRRQTFGTGGTDLYALRDTMNVVALVGQVGGVWQVTQRMAYDAFGNTRFLTSTFAAGSNAAGWNHLFHGHYRDAETGLYQMRFRYYHPNLGVWLSRDPIGERGGINVTSFNINNPPNTFDVRGLEPRVHSADPSFVFELTRDNYFQDLIRRYGCVAITRSVQGYTHNPYGGSPKFNPEDGPGVVCFETEREAKRHKCPNKKRPVIFAVQGTRVPGTTRTANTPVPVNSIITGDKSNRFNYCVIIKGRYYWTTNAGEPILSDTTPSKAFDESQTIYCVDCLCPGARSRVICTYLHDLGLLESALWKADIDFTRTLSHRTIRGYHFWAIPCVHLMRQWRLLTLLIRPLARARAQEVAFVMKRSSRGSLLGKFVRLVGEPLCFIIGSIVPAKPWQSLWQDAGIQKKI